MKSEALSTRVMWDRNVAARLNALGVPDESAREITSVLRRCANLPNVLRRRSIAKKWIRRDGVCDLHTLETDGYINLTDDLKEQTDPCVAALRAYIESLEGQTKSRTGPKKFLFEMATRELLERTPEIFDLVLSDTILDCAIRYLGTVPILQNIAFSWTPANDTLSKSQLFHSDNIDRRQLKFSMNVTDVKPQNGPFTFIPARQSDRIVSDWRSQNSDYVRGRRIADEFILERVPAEQWSQATGPGGTIMGVDTCRCLHCGARTREGYRVTLRFNFTRRDSHRMFNFIPPAVVAARYADDPLRSMILTQ